MNRKLFMSSSAVILTASIMLSACGGNADTSASGDSKQAAAKETNKPAATDPTNAKVVDSLTVTLGGASPGGFWSLVGEGVGNILRQAIPNTQFSYETGNGVSNTINAASGKLSMGLAHNFEIKAALEGMEPYKQKLPQVTALATVYNNVPQQFVISKEFSDKYGINSLEDLAMKKPPIRVAINQRGNLVEMINRVAFEANGFTYDDIKKWGGEVYYEPYKTAADMMKDNKVDLFGSAVFAPDGKMLELATSKKIMLLPINEKAQKLLEERMGVSSSIIPAKSYEWQDKDVASINVSAIITADPNMSNDEAYTITKTMVENIDKIQNLHKNLKVLTPEIMVNVAPAKLHPGAEIYFKEKGLIK